MVYMVTKIQFYPKSELYQKIPMGTQGRAPQDPRTSSNRIVVDLRSKSRLTEEGRKVGVGIAAVSRKDGYTVNTYVVNN